MSGGYIKGVWRLPDWWLHGFRRIRLRKFKSGQVQLGQVKSGQVKSRQVKSGQFKSELILGTWVWPCSVLLVFSSIGWSRATNSNILVSKTQKLISQQMKTKCVSKYMILLLFSLRPNSCWTQLALISIVSAPSSQHPIPCIQVVK